MNKKSSIAIICLLVLIFVTNTVLLSRVISLNKRMDRLEGMNSVSITSSASNTATPSETVDTIRKDLQVTVIPTEFPGELYSIEDMSAEEIFNECKYYLDLPKKFDAEGKSPDESELAFKDCLKKNPKTDNNHYFTTGPDYYHYPDVANSISTISFSSHRETNDSQTIYCISEIGIYLTSSDKEKTYAVYDLLKQLIDDYDQTSGTTTESLGLRTTTYWENDTKSLVLTEIDEGINSIYLHYIFSFPHSIEEFQ